MKFLGLLSTRVGAGVVVVAIDGPAGAGKSTVARFVAENLEFIYLNSGNLYRAVTFLALEAHIENEPASIVSMMKRIVFEMTADGIIADGKVIGPELRSDRVEAVVAQISAIPELRIQVNELLKRLSNSKNVVVEGRDMTTVVFPDAEIKIYLDASIDSRADRRFSQKTSRMAVDEIKKTIETRDKIDESKRFGGLRRASDAYYLDTTSLTIDQVCAKVVRYIQGH